MRIHIQGWRFLPHSVAIANQFQLLEMLKRSDLQVSDQSLPYLHSHWQAVQHLFEAEDQHNLEQLTKAFSPDTDLILRMAEPVNLQPSPFTPMVIFAMAEWGTLFDENFTLKTLKNSINLDSSLRLITPSQWSKEGLIRYGFDGSKITIVPWGVDPKLYKPLTQTERTFLRKQLGWDDSFIFLNVSPMEDRNGIRPLLKAFVPVVERYPHARLVLKGCDALYPSKQSLLTASRSILTEAEVAKIRPNIAYIGETFSFQKMAQLYQAADAYVCPYAASGFHLSALEAMATGLPVICTKGGSTDDFVHPDFSLKIESKFRTRIINQKIHFFLHPDNEHLVQLMQTVIENSQLRQQAREVLPSFVHHNYTWKHTVNQLLEGVEKNTASPVIPQGFIPQDSTHTPSLFIQGWRFIPHSYALINSYQLLELQRRPNLEIFYQDMPYVTEDWKPVEGLLAPEAEQRLKQISIAPKNPKADVTLRMYCPFDLSNSQSPKTFIFGCTEWGIVPQSILRGMKISCFRDAHLNSDTTIITSSHWSRQGFLNSGAVSERVVVVPLGVEPLVYHPLKPDQRQALRQKLGWDNAFVFLNIGVMWNERQGIDRLLKSFAILTEKYSDIRLVLKGRDAIFPSKESIQKASKNVLTEAEVERVKARTYYIGHSLSALEMAELFQAADAYVSPYSAEGFNLPVLEAMACGLPVICTEGGPTDDFVQPECVWKIESKLKMIAEKNGDIKCFLEPNTQHLLQLMEAILQDSSFRLQAYKKGPRVVENRFTWKQVVDQLMKVLFAG